VQHVAVELDQFVVESGGGNSVGIHDVLTVKMEAAPVGARLAIVAFQMLSLLAKNMPTRHSPCGSGDGALVRACKP
ncbi:MAG TPA: hypothetical protein VHB77_07220, partial [Planctomycetaceae bacterium]|nr:hypothetical protein [Planctomycetaceae bacterium]